MGRYQTCYSVRPILAQVQFKAASVYSHRFFIQQLHLCNASAWLRYQLSRCYAVRDEERGLWIHDEGASRTNIAANCLWISQELWLQSSSPLSLWWRFCRRLGNQQKSSLMLGDAIHFGHQLLWNSIYFVLQWQQSSDSALADAVDALEYGCDSLQ